MTREDSFEQMYQPLVAQRCTSGYATRIRTPFVLAAQYPHSPGSRHDSRVVLGALLGWSGPWTIDVTMKKEL
jgi:hypothetical protein